MKRAACHLLVVLLLAASGVDLCRVWGGADAPSESVAMDGALCCPQPSEVIRMLEGGAMLRAYVPQASGRASSRAPSPPPPGWAAAVCVLFALLLSAGALTGRAARRPTLPVGSQAPPAWAA